MSSEEQLRRHAEKVLRQIGVQERQTILDCRCGSGAYTIAAAQLVGEQGVVYAIDTNSKKLQDLRQTVNATELTNVEIIEANVTAHLPVPTGLVDIVLLYDIFWYFRPTESKLPKLLKEMYRVAKADALISVYPAHLNSSEVKWFKNEMEQKGFSFENEYFTQLVHEGRIENGNLLDFSKRRDGIRKLEQQIDDLKARFPAHSVSPSMVQELEELEAKLAEAKQERL
jgi:ubiquinone/menaquinone biosynthesis C-methylase UbiE